MRQSLIRRQPTKRCRKVKKHTTVKEIIKRCRRKNLCTAFFYPIKQSKIRKERQRFCGTTNLPELFTTSYLYLHNAYLSSTPSAQHNSRINAHSVHKLFAILAKRQTPMIFVLRYFLVRRICRNVRTHITEKIIFVNILQQAFSTLNLCYITHKNFSIVQKSGQLNAVRLVILFYRNDVVVNRLTAVYKVYIKI